MVKLITDINREIFRTLPVHCTNIFPVKLAKSEYPINSKNYFLFNHDANYCLDFAEAWLDTFTQGTRKDDNSKIQNIKT